VAIPPTPVRIVIADARPLRRLGIASALGPPGFVVCAECADAGAAVLTAVRERPEICIVDAGLPGGGIAATRAIVTWVPQARVVVLAESADLDLFLASVRAGAVGFLLADIDPRRLPHALRDVVDGKVAVPRSFVAPIVAEIAGPQFSLAGSTTHG
jgi:DNA-binding NarL/FixJ family response regulator